MLLAEIIVKKRESKIVWLEVYQNDGHRDAQIATSPHDCNIKHTYIL